MDGTQYEIIVKAGPNKGSSDIYRYVCNPLPKWTSSPDDPFYRALVKSALDAAREVVKHTGQDITLKLTTQ